MWKKFILPVALIIAATLIWAATSAPGGLRGLYTQFSAITGLNAKEVDNAQSTLLLQVPDGFTIQVFADNLRHARFMLVTETGDLLVSSVDDGKIWLLRDSDGDRVADQRHLLMEGLTHPQGLTMLDDWLYFSERDSVHRVKFDLTNGRLADQPESVITDLPYGGRHWSHDVKTIAISPDRQWLHVNIGSPCNACEPVDPRFSTMMRFPIGDQTIDASEGAIYASGLRNSEGLDWAPWSGELYATDNGRDMLGDDFPPCELNRIVEGGFYGWPYINGDGVLDPDNGAGKEALLETAISPSHGFRAHNAPLGMVFNRSDALPEDFAQSAFVALHGSWNRSELDGYKVVSLHWGEDGAITERDFVTGFLQPSGVIGRPVDVAQAADGVLYVTDDLSNRVYVISHE